MESKDVSSGLTMEITPAAEVKENDHNDTSATEEPSPAKTSVEESPSAEKKQRRSSGRRNRCDIDIMEEAKAAYGDLGATEGRRLRKRAEPPKVEKATPPPPKRKSGGTPGRKKANKEEPKMDEDSAEPATEDTKTDSAAAVAPSSSKSDTKSDDVKEDKKEESTEAPIATATAAAKAGDNPDPTADKVVAAAAPVNDAWPDTEKPVEVSDQKTATEPPAATDNEGPKDCPAE